MSRTDVFSPADRSAVMRAVKSSNTAPERLVRAALRALGYARRYRLNGASLIGKPDIVFGAIRKAIFVHGCFWHGHDCARGARKPKANAAYWRDKIDRNKKRDGVVRRTLRRAGWKVLIVWECETHKGPALNAKLARFLDGPGLHSSPTPSASRRVR
ncbi:MAG: very short patch repair endonuclease [Hyphomonadaceae bacterium]|nr:very short patch repair endonuclease [Hyphomonadaceae bacterium]